MDRASSVSSSAAGGFGAAGAASSDSSVASKAVPDALSAESVVPRRKRRRAVYKASRLPDQLESLCFEFLDADSLCDLRFASRGVHGSLCGHLATARRLDFDDHDEFSTVADPNKQPYLRSIRFVLRHCRKLREVSFGNPEHAAAWEPELDRLHNWLLPRLMLACSSTLETVKIARGWGEALLAAAVQCPRLRVITHAADSDDTQLQATRLRRLVSGCPNLEALDFADWERPHVDDDEFEEDAPPASLDSKTVLELLRVGRPLTTLALSNGNAERLREWTPCVRWPLLQSLDLTLDERKEGYECWRLLLAALRSAGSLTRLSVRGVALLSQQEALGLARHEPIRLPKLRSLSLELAVSPVAAAFGLLPIEAPALTELEAPSLLQAALVSEFCSTVRLEKLTVATLALEAESAASTEADLQRLLKQHGDTLRAVACVEALAPAAIRALAARCSKLEEIDCVVADAAGQDGSKAQQQQADALPRQLLLALAPRLRKLALRSAERSTPAGDNGDEAEAKAAAPGQEAKAAPAGQEAKAGQDAKTAAGEQKAAAAADDDDAAIELPLLTFLELSFLGAPDTLRGLQFPALHDLYLEGSAADRALELGGCGLFAPEVERITLRHNRRLDAFGVARIVRTWGYSLKALTLFDCSEFESLAPLFSASLPWPLLARQFASLSIGDPGYSLRFTPMQMVALAFAHPNLVRFAFDGHPSTGAGGMSAWDEPAVSGMLYSWGRRLCFPLPGDRNWAFRPDAEFAAAAAAAASAAATAAAAAAAAPALQRLTRPSGTTE